MRHYVWRQHVIWAVPFIWKPQPEDLMVNWVLSAGNNLDPEGKGAFRPRNGNSELISPQSKPVRKIQVF